jgi:plasmid stabilization system protein ParE
MVEVNWADQSLEDINSIAEFIAKDSLRYANIQVQRFFDRTEILYKNPNAGRIVPEVNNAAIRELILGNYRIIYRIITHKRIDVLTIHHSMRRLENNPIFE